MTTLFIPKERRPGERRVAATPETVKKMVERQLEVLVETGAGDHAHLPDERYGKAGARIVQDAAEGWQSADLVLKVAPPTEEEASQLQAGAVVIGFLAPYREDALVRLFAENKITSLPMELVPRITRAQSMDALSSQASVAGYKAAILAAQRLDRYFPLLMTAAGTIPPARVVIFGGGVAGLQAVATAKRLGALVEVSDIRPAVKEQVESLGGRFIDLPMQETGEGEGGYAKEMGEDFLRRQREIVTEHVTAADVVITTAQVPGKKAPTLVTRDMVDGMRPGSVIIDLAAEQGGNCELTAVGEEVDHQGVLILGPANLNSSVPLDSSTVYARNLLNLLTEILDDGNVKVDRDNDVVGPTLLTHEGEIVHKATAERLEGVSS